MAATAEILQLETHQEREITPRYIDADTHPQLNFARRSAHTQAERILESNRELLRQGEFDTVPIPVDPLGTARKLDEVERQYGANSTEYETLWGGLYLDCQRLLAEA